MRAYRSLPHTHQHVNELMTQNTSVFKYGRGSSPACVRPTGQTRSAPESPMVSDLPMSRRSS